MSDAPEVHQERAARAKCSPRVEPGSFCGALLHKGKYGKVWKHGEIFQAGLI